MSTWCDISRLNLGVSWCWYQLNPEAAFSPLSSLILKLTVLDSITPSSVGTHQSSSSGYAAPWICMDLFHPALARSLVFFWGFPMSQTRNEVAAWRSHRRVPASCASTMSISRLRTWRFWGCSSNLSEIGTSLGSTKRLMWKLTILDR